MARPLDECEEKRSWRLVEQSRCASWVGLVHRAKCACPQLDPMARRIINDRVSVGMVTTRPTRVNCDRRIWIPCRRSDSSQSKPASEPIGNSRGPRSPPISAASTSTCVPSTRSWIASALIYPHWSSAFCADPDQARKTRIATLEEASDGGFLVCPAHFGGSHCCTTERRGAHFRYLSAAGTGGGG